MCPICEDHIDNFDKIVIDKRLQAIMEIQNEKEFIMINRDEFVWEYVGTI
jgi:hypothetical protein